MHTVFNLHGCFWILDIAVGIGVWYRRGSGGSVARKAQLFGRYGEEAVLQGFDSLVDDGVYGIDYIIDKGLEEVISEDWVGGGSGEVAPRVCIESAQ